MILLARASRALLVGCAAVPVVLSSCSASGPSSDGSTVPATAVVTACDATKVGSALLPSVVTISATDGTTATTGSGAVMRGDGYVVTNNHVVARAATAATGTGAITVVFSDGASAPATIVGRDSATDLAIVRVTVSVALPAVPFGTSTSVQLGQPVVAAGAPLGLSNSISTGIVSGVGRTVHVPTGSGGVAVLLGAIQTDAAINPGNSGGPLVDCAGSLVGVNTAIATVAAEGEDAGNIGVGFAIPSDLARAVADRLIAAGSVTHSYLGLEVAEIPPTTPGQAVPAPGLRVVAVDPAGPAVAAGLVVGDVIIAVDGQPTASATQLALVTMKKAPGDTVVITSTRAGTTADAPLVLTPSPWA